MKSDIDRILQPPVEALNELRGLVREAEKVLGQASGEVREATVDALRKRFEAAQDRLTSLYNNSREKVVAGARRTDEVIRENPYQSIAIAAGIGLLAGLLISRRR